jgi:hypothetical protein
MCQHNQDNQPLVGRIDLASLYSLRSRASVVRFISPAELQAQESDLLNLDPSQATPELSAPTPQLTTTSPARRIEVR